MSDSTTRSGVQLDLQRGPLSIPFTEREYDYTNPNSDATARVTGQEAVSGVDQTPLDRDAAKVRTYDIAAIQAAALAQDPTVTLGKVRVPLPDVLTSIAVTYTKSSGAGTSSHPAANQQGVISGAGGVSLDPRASSQGSATISPTITWRKKSPSSVLVNCENYFFFAASPMTMATALTKINTVAPSAVLDLPLLYPEEVMFLTKGGQVSVRAGADTSIHIAKSDAASTSSGDVEYGTDSSLEVGQQTQRDVIPESLHNTFTLTASDSQTVTVTGDSSTIALAAGAITISAITNTISVTGTAAASIVIPYLGTAVIPATTPVDIPHTGRYLVAIEGSEDIAGLVLVHATVVNFVQYV